MPIAGPFISVMTWVLRGELARIGSPTGSSQVQLGLLAASSAHEQVDTSEYGVTALVALAALVVGIVALVTRPDAVGIAATSSNEPIAVAPSDTTEADGALCSAVAPLMAENDATNNT